MARLNLRGRWILITGSSSGLGREIARYLARQEAANLVVAARRKENLEMLKEELEAAYGIRVEVIPIDLSRERDVEILFEKATEIAQIDVLINNAGLTSYGKTEIQHMDIYHKIIDVDFKALVQLSLLFLSYFQKIGTGVILNITSEGAFIPMPYQNVYAAAKHAAQCFSEGLREENRGSNIIILTFAPGGIATEMITKSGLDRKISLNNPVNMKPEKVAKKVVQALKKKKRLVIPGFLNKLTVFLIRFLPRNLIIRIAGLIYHPSAEKANDDRVDQ